MNWASECNEGRTVYTATDNDYVYRVVKLGECWALYSHQIDYLGNIDPYEAALLGRYFQAASAAMAAAERRII